ncbi:MAG: flavin reductase family protein [Proteobacteria bacterium]|nr:flavin reductase family protein [Pseudomonadota bacterium]
MADADLGRRFRDVMGHFATGIVVATGQHEGKPAGFAAQSFLSLSMEPALVALAPAKTSTSWPKLRASGSFCINILGADQKAICDKFAQTGIEKFSTFGWRPGVTGSPVLDGILAYIDCDLEVEHDAGDHTIAIGRVRDLAMLDSTSRPLVFYRGGYGQFKGL